MKFSYRLVQTLPRLAWCAVLTRQARDVVVYHGADVEVCADAFFEGAWNGNFDDAAFDTASVFCGSGARLRAGRIVFATDTGVMDWIYSVRVGNRRYVSNSMAFLYAITDDRPDPAYPFYPYDLLHYTRLGLLERNRFLRTARGRRLQLHWACNLELDSSLDFRECRKADVDEPGSFSQYVDLLVGAFAQLADNAANRNRKLPFTPLSALSRGYDGNACAALVSSLGYREGFTFDNLVQEDFENNRPDDSGREVGRALGMDVHPVSFTAYRRLPVPRDDEFCANPGGSEAPLAGLEPLLVGRLQVSARIGDRIWSTTEADPDFVRGDLTYIAGISIKDFRLRVGFLRIDLPQIGASHPAAIHRICMSGEMRPWRIPGDYNRPIPRRILEERGVPRHLFGRQKIAGGFVNPAIDIGALSPRARADYDSFAGGNRRFSLPARLWSAGPVLLRQLVGAFRLPGVKSTLSALQATLALARRLFNRQLVTGFYTYHWGVERLRERYRVVDRDHA